MLLLDDSIQEIGVTHVVQFIIDKVATYMADGEAPHIVLDSMCSHCIDLSIEDMGKFYCMRDAIELPKSIMKSIHNLLQILTS